MTRIETVLIIQQDSKILLGFKNPNKKFGGKWNGFGGGLEDGQTIEECAIKETYDETGIFPKDLKILGKILFHFLTDEQDHEVYFLRAQDYEGDLDTTKDFVKYDWFNKDKLKEIYNEMMPADKDWLSFFIDGKMFSGEICFGKKDGEFYVEYSKINEVDRLD